MTDVLPSILLAKSTRADREPLTLEQHLFDTEQAAVSLFGEGSRWRTSFCRFFRLEGSAIEQFLLNLRLAALFHDLGKANEDFQRAVSGRGSTVQQTIRHEHLSALVLHLPEVRDWLSANADVDAEVVTAAALSHHFKASATGDWRWCRSASGKTRLDQYFAHAEVKAVFKRVAECAALAPPPELPVHPWGHSLWNAAYQHGVRAATAFALSLKKDSRRLSLCLAVKAGLIAADAAASGLVREGHPIQEWIDSIVRAPNLSADDDIGRDIVERRVHSIRERVGQFTLHEFQRRAARLGERALLLAPCGAGKTLAAWEWVKAQARERRIGRVVFLYPTRGTATEGFRDYVGWAPDSRASLVHGTARYELEAMRANPPESARDKSYSNEASERLYALGLWPKRYFSATVDQFLAFLEHGYRSTCLLPVLADSAVIIDEVHSFDRLMFENLLDFLKHFDVPALCMTATLSPSRRRQLQGQGLRVYPSEEDREALQDLEEKERHLRYRLRQVAGEEEALARAIEVFRAGRRVLWVVNQVARCQALAESLSRTLGADVLCYHSRFRLQDRARRHRETVDAFQSPDRRALAVTTQVCEMSLDLDADLLITELAPLSALIQRFGRANRHLKRGMDFRADLLLYEPDNIRPYSREELDATRDSLRELVGEGISQRHLAEVLERYAPDERSAGPRSRFVGGGYYATAGSFRDADDFTNPCVLTEDLPCVRAVVDTREPIDGWIVPVPRRFVLPAEERPSWLPTHLGVAASASYHPTYGFRAEEASS